MELAKKIIKESFFVLALTAAIVLAGGVALKSVEDKFVVLIPFIIVLPALIDAAGDFSTIITARFTTALYEKKIKLKKWPFFNKEVKHILRDSLPAAFILGLWLGVVTLIVSVYNGFTFNSIFFIKFFLVIILVILFIFYINFFIAILGGYYVYKKKGDPDDFLIPITTSLADFLGLVILAILIKWLF